MMRTFILGLMLALPGVVAADAPPPRPDCTAPEHRQFDFWLGEWEVRDATTGEVAGRNTIESVMNSCVLHEQWRGAGGMTGESFNLYDRHSGQWHQTWVDSNGTRLQLAGGLHDGAMVLSGEMPHRQHGSVRHRITWTPAPDGTVRQHWEYSTEAGDTWQTLFDGIYARP